MGWRRKRWHRQEDVELCDLQGLFAKLWPHKMMLESSRYDKWGGGGGGGAPGGGGGTSGGTWAGRERERERERDRERERQARAHQMIAPEPDASTLFPAPFRVTDNKDRVSQQIQNKLGDYLLAQTLLDDPSKSIGICAEPASPAPCHPSRRESEFKRPGHAPQNGRVHHRPYYSNKNEVGSSVPSQSHRPPPLRIPNGFQHPSSIDSGSQPPIESILKEMKSLPTPLSVIAATPRKELDNKFIFNPYTNKVQENPQLTCNDLKAPLSKPGLDNRLSESRSPVSPELVQKDLGISSDDETAATTTRLHPILSPIGSGGSQSSGSESSASDSESESSSTESSSTAAPPAAPAPPERSSWSLSNFAFPVAQPQQPSYDSGKDVEHVLADAKGKPSPISELSDTEASSPSPDETASDRRRRRSKRTSCSDDEPSSANTSSPRVSTPSSSGGKRGRPPKPPPAKKKRGRPPKHRPPSEEPPPPPQPPQPPPHIQPLSAIDTKTHIFRKVFTPKKGDEGGGKGGKGGKGKGGKGKGQVTIIEVTAPDDDDRRRDRSDERRKNEEAIAARLSPPKDFTSPRRHDRLSDRSDRHSDRSDRLSDRSDRMSDRSDRQSDRSDRQSSDRSDRRSSDRMSSDRLSDRPTITSPRLPPDRLPITSDRLSDKLRIPDRTERMANERLQAERVANERLQAERLANERLQAERLANERLQAERLSQERANDRLQTIDRLQAERLTADRSDRGGDRLPVDRLTSKLSIERLERDRMERMSAERVSERYVKAEADVGSGLVKSERGSERLTDPCSNERRSRSTANRIMVRIPLSRLRTDTVRALQLAANKRALLRHTANNTVQRVETPCAATMTPVPEVESAGSVLALGGLGGCGGLAGGGGAAGEPGEGGPIYYSYFERLPPDALSDEERDHQYYLGEAGRLRQAAEAEAGAVPRVMLYLESVLCFVLTGRVLELELDTKQAFTIYRETIEYIRSIHAMPQRYRASPCSTFTKLDILSLRVQALLYLRMFKMYNREVKEYYKIVQEYQQKPASAESVSPLSPSPIGAGSGGSLGAGSGGSGGSASSGYYSLAHPVPAPAHHALLQLTKYYTFLYVAHELWEQADCLCRLRPNQDLFIAVDRKCGPLTLFSTFRHLVQYVRYAISLLKNLPQE